MSRNIYKVIRKSSFIPIVVVLGIYLLLILSYIRPYQHNLSSLLKIDERNANYRAELIPAGTVVFHGNGYDGQYNYYIAKDLVFKDAFTDAFRYQRILYPLLAKVVSFGNDRWLCYSFIIINLLSILLGMIYLKKLIEMNQAKTSLNSLLILYGLNLGFILGTLYDLGTPLAISLMVVGLYFCKREKVGLCSLFLACSLLTMENAILVIVPLFLYFIWKKAVQKSIFMLISMVPWLLWQLILWNHFRVIPILSSAGVLTLPFYGMAQQLFDIISHHYSSWTELLRQTNIVWMMLFVLVSLVISVALFSKYKDLFSLLVAGQALFGVLLSQPMIWAHTITSPARVLCGIFPWLILVYIQNLTNKWTHFLICFSWFLSLLGIFRVFVLPYHSYFIK